MKRFAWILPVMLMALLATSALAQKSKRNSRPATDTAATRSQPVDTANGALRADTMNTMNGMDGMADSARMGMHCAMMGPMMSKQILLGRDGGVFVLMGNHLMKYDDRLTLVKDVKLNIDMNEMCRTMQEFMSSCPMMQKKMQGPGGTR